MKHLFTVLVCAAAACGVNAETIPQRFVGITAESYEKALAEAGVKRQLPQLKEINVASDNNFKVTADVKVNTERKQYVFSVIAVPSGEHEQGFIKAKKRKGVFSFSIPAGTYDFMAIVDVDVLYDERTFLIQEDVEINDDTTLNFDVADAIYSTRISHTDSFGNTLALPSYTEPSNCTSGDFLDLVMHNGVLSWAAETVAQMESNYIYSTNKIDSRFNFTRLDNIGATSEVAGYVIPIDFGKEICGPTSNQGWQVAQQSFAATPFNKALDEYYIGYIGHPSYYTFSARGVFIDGAWWGHTALGILDMECNSGRTALWAPIGYDGIFENAIFPCGNVFSGDYSCFQSLPLVRGDHGLVQVGLNYGTSDKMSFFTADAQSQNASLQNPRFAVKPTDGTVGNYVPLLFATPFYTGINFTYKGRFGEEMSLDAFDIFRSLEEDDTEMIEKVGRQPCDIKIYADETEICSSIRDLSGKINWKPNTMHHAVLKMDNVLIDGEMTGCNSADIYFDIEKGNGFAPSFSSLQFRNKEDAVCDRFDNADEGVIEFTVADFNLEYNEDKEYTYFSINPVKSVKAEYAPHGSADFLPLEVTEIPELFFSPGYGYFYRGSLASVNRNSDDGWFDVRLYADDEDGCSITQTISPAFHISGAVGVNKTTLPSGRLDYKVEGRRISVAEGTSIYSADGKRCDGTGLNPGLYIITDGIHNEKVIIK